MRSGVKRAGMLTILVKSVVNNNNNTLEKSIANTNNNTFVTILSTVYYIQQRSLFSRSTIKKINRMIVVEKMAKLL